MLDAVDRITARLAEFVARYQSLIALVCVVVLACDFLPGFDLPQALVVLLSAFAGVLGVARPTETAAKIAGEVASHRGGIKIAALIAALAGALAVAPEAVEEDKPDAPAAPSVIVIDNDEKTDAPPLESKDAGQ